MYRKEGNPHFTRSVVTFGTHPNYPAGSSKNLLDLFSSEVLSLATINVYKHFINVYEYVVGDINVWMLDVYLPNLG